MYRRKRKKCIIQPISTCNLTVEGAGNVAPEVKGQSGEAQLPPSSVRSLLNDAFIRNTIAKATEEEGRPGKGHHGQRYLKKVKDLIQDDRLCETLC